jgi:hypothetical protein
MLGVELPQAESESDSACGLCGALVAWLVL